MKKFSDKLFSPIDPILLGVFRVGFGLFLFWESLYFFRTHLVEDYLIAPKFHFQYSFLPLTPMDAGTMNFMLVLLSISAILISIGVLYRFAITSYFLIFSYFMLLDKVFYNNHLYLISLLCLILFFIPADRAMTIFNWSAKKPLAAMKTWHLWILRFQLMVVYFYGGIAKLNSDWLFYGEPARTLLAYKGIHSEFWVSLISYTGIVFDLSIGFLLLFKKTRMLAVAGVLIFNFSNHYLFSDINFFPFLMIFSTILFLDNEGVSKWIGKVFSNRNTIREPMAESANRRLVPIILLSCYFLFQILFPFRHYLIPGNVDWTGEAQRFSWRMKIQNRSVQEMEFAVFDLDTRQIFPVNTNQYINTIQENQMIHYPRMILDFAHFLAEYSGEKHKMNNVMVKVKARVSMNDRKAQYIVDPDLDLLTVQWSNWHNEWIIPIEKR